MISELLKTSYNDKLDDEGRWMLDSLNSASGTLSKLVDGILHHTRTVNATDTHKETFQFKDVAETLKQILDIPAGFSFTYDNPDMQIHTCRAILMQILINLCVNAIKYNDKPNGSIHITASDEGRHYHFSVIDNGPGIPATQHEKIFELFTTLDNTNKGNGIGLSTVKRLVEKQGSMNLTSEMGNGSNFSFTVRK